MSIDKEEHWLRARMAELRVETKWLKHKIRRTRQAIADLLATHPTLNAQNHSSAPASRQRPRNRPS